MVLPLFPLANIFLSLLNTTLKIFSVSSVRVFIFLPVATSHSRGFHPHFHLRVCCCQRWKATVLTQCNALAASSLIALSCLPVAVSQMQIVSRSLIPHCNHLSIGLKTMLLISAVKCPGNVYPERFLSFRFVSGDSIPELDGIVPVACEC